ncbi:unnamed protein product [Phyllotreta striolata]|uniref:UBX domain-containing protein 1 n=1 Tax=Phyllotreta striolata TaxID=444603 RepID=A0A9N9XWU9_PHYSR|nr:unnamed protein product [Phyllotreta striolata]
MSNIIDTLIEMGFNKEKAELAVSRTGSSDVQVVMDWLLSHDADVDVPPQIPTNDNSSTKDSEDVPEEDSSKPETPAPVVKSIQCDHCGKLFQTNEEVEFHASKTGHENFSESSEEKKPLTDEEKKEKLAKIEAKLKQRRLERESKEKEEALLREKNRIKSGKELLEAKRKHEELEMKKFLEQKKREKEEERLAKQRIREQIEQDKLARKAKFGGVVEESATSSAPTPAAPAAATVTKVQTNYSKAKLQIKLPDGTGLTETFGAKEPLSAVRVFIEMKGKVKEGAFTLMTTFPKKIFVSDDYDKPLDSLGLAPTAVLIVQKSK